MQNKFLFVGLLIFSFTKVIYSQTKLELNYATYIGGTGDDEFACNFQLSENDDIYLVMDATLGSKTTPGVHQMAYGGGKSDVLIQKRDKNANLIWSTYFGGTGAESVFNSKLLKSGKIAIVGQTTSTSKIAKNGHQNTLGGGSLDGFLAVFNVDGTLDWATYFGGSSGDEATMYCGEDNEGSIYICGFTKSITNIATPGSYQPTNKGGYDGYLAKFSPEGTLVWSTYIGGTGLDALYVLNIDKNDVIWIGGSTSSTNGIATDDAYKKINSGGNDGFLMSFDKEGNRLYGTYYGGTGNDEIYILDFDESENMWIGGVTKSNVGIATPGAIKTLYSGDYDAFLIKFNKNLTREWGTYLGGKKFDSFFSISFDKDGSALLALITENNDFFPITDAMQEEYGGGSYDAVYTKIDPAGNLIWSTYYGGEGDDRGCDIKINSEGKLITFGISGSINMNTNDGGTSQLKGELDGLLSIFTESKTNSLLPWKMEARQLTVFPNPASDWINVLNPENVRRDIYVYNVLGQLVLKFPGTTDSIFDISMLLVGKYFVKTVNGKEIQIAGIVKKE